MLREHCQWEKKSTLILFFGSWPQKGNKTTERRTLRRVAGEHVCGQASSRGAWLSRAFELNGLKLTGSQHCMGCVGTASKSQAAQLTARRYQMFAFGSNRARNTEREIANTADTLLYGIEHEPGAPHSPDVRLRLPTNARAPHRSCLQEDLHVHKYR